MYPKLRKHSKADGLLTDLSKTSFMCTILITISDILFIRSCSNKNKNAF